MKQSNQFSLHNKDVNFAGWQIKLECRSLKKRGVREVEISWGVGENKNCWVQESEKYGVQEVEKLWGMGGWKNCEVQKVKKKSLKTNSPQMQNLECLTHKKSFFFLVLLPYLKKKLHKMCNFVILAKPIILQFQVSLIISWSDLLFVKLSSLLIKIHVMSRLSGHWSSNFVSTLLSTRKKTSSYNPCKWFTVKHCFLMMPTARCTNIQKPNLMISKVLVASLCHPLHLPYTVIHMQW